MSNQHPVKMIYKITREAMGIAFETTIIAENDDAETAAKEVNAALKELGELKNR